MKLSVLLLERWERFLVGNVADRDGYGHVHLSSKRHVRHHLNVKLEIDSSHVTVTNLHVNLVGILNRILLIVIGADGDLWYDEKIVESFFTIWLHGAHINSFKNVISDILNLTVSFLPDSVLQIEPSVLDHFVGVVQYLSGDRGHNDTLCNLLLYFDIDCSLFSTNKPSFLHVDVQTYWALGKAPTTDIGLFLAVYSLKCLNRLVQVLDLIDEHLERSFSVNTPWNVHGALEHVGDGGPWSVKAVVCVLREVELELVLLGPQR